MPPTWQAGACRENLHENDLVSIHYMLISLLFNYDFVTFLDF